MELLEKIPPEPPADTPNVISVVFKLSNGERIERRFLHSDALMVMNQMIIIRLFAIIN